MSGDEEYSEYVTINEAGGKLYEFKANGIYLLRNDIDASGIDTWISIGTNEHPFTGTFEGANHTITNITSPTVAGTEENYQGLFGKCENAEIRNIDVVANK